MTTETGADAVPGLLTETTDGVLRLTLDRPDRRNAVDDVMMRGLIDALEVVATDDSVRAVVLTGAGEDFCSGADIVARNAGGGDRPVAGSIQRRLPTQAHRLIPLVLEVQKPVVAVVRGWAAGLGFQLALAADFCVTATDARFWEPFLTRGFTPDSGATWMLPHRVGEVRARELLMLGRELTGTEAADWGLVHRAVSPEVLDEESDALVAALASGPTVALGLTKRLLHQGRERTLAEQLAAEAFAMELSSRAEDFREGLAAFRDKRVPEFKGR